MPVKRAKARLTGMLFRSDVTIATGMVHKCRCVPGEW